ncbi:unnamed protein product [Linum trigynum]|uniref:Uncharacterized protein n=1 Tax=Linum trigynum TaxID=586398 RepID=A0AAV2DNN9_9ROSI
MSSLSLPDPRRSRLRQQSCPFLSLNFSEQSCPCPFIVDLTSANRSTHELVASSNTVSRENEEEEAVKQEKNEAESEGDWRR